MLSKDSMKGMDLLEASTDVLYTLDQWMIVKQEASRNKLREKLQRGCNLLDLLASAIRGQVTKGQQRDLFTLRVVESLEKITGLPPSKLYEKIQKVKAKLKEEAITPETIDLFEKISQTTMCMTSRSVDALSTSLR